MNEDHLRRLRYEPETWNAWRQDNPSVRPDLSEAEVNWLVRKTHLYNDRSVFRAFQECSFQAVDLHDADLRKAKIWTSDLTSANLRGADLRGAEIKWTKLVRSDLRGADLRNAQFIRADLTEAQMEGAVVGETYFGFSPLRNVGGLGLATCRGKSYLDQFSIINSTSLDPRFLEGCRIPLHIVRIGEMFVATHPYDTCFISYSRRDESFAGYLREALAWLGVPSWFAPQDLRAREVWDSVDLERDLFSYIDEAERTLLIISPNILFSRWVAREVAHASTKLPLLIEDMPAPESQGWADGIGQIEEDGVPELYKRVDSKGYSDYLTDILKREQFLDFRGWRDPCTLARSVYGLPWMLRRPAQNPLQK